MKNILKITSIFLVLVIMISSFTSCGDDIVDGTSGSADGVTSQELPARSVLKIGYNGFRGYFNPFYASDENDMDVVQLTSVHLLTFDRDGVLVENAINGETRSYNGTDYKYQGISNVSYSVDADGYATYEFELRQDVKFSDGKVMTVDDVIFTMYVLSDPSYDGPMLFCELPIIGLDEYKGGLVDKIEGIEKTGEYSFKVRMSYIAIDALSMLNIYVAPLHYYGQSDLYDYENNKFGFEKGNLGFLKEKAGVAFGAGPYYVKKYSDDVIYLQYNEHYYKGTPQLKSIELKVADENRLIQGVVNGDFDIAMPYYDRNVIESIKQVNGGEISGALVSTLVSESQGYGYIGICSDTVKVGTDKESVESKNLRKAFATLFSVYRYSAVTDYFGESAKVINYPFDFENSVYDGIYSTDVNGNGIYTSDTDEADMVSAAFLACIEYFKAAGFVFDESAGKFTAAPDGASLAYQVYVAGNNVEDHPAYNIFANAKNALNSIGITLILNDVEENVMWDMLDRGQCQIWAAAWNNIYASSMYSIYHSSNINGLNGSTGLNVYGITDDTLDGMLVMGKLSSEDLSESTLFFDCYEIITDWAVEIPVYRRINAVVFNTQAVNVDTFPEDFNEHWDWIYDIEKIQLNIGF